MGTARTHCPDCESQAIVDLSTGALDRLRGAPVWATSDQ